MVEVLLLNDYSLFTREGSSTETTSLDIFNSMAALYAGSGFACTIQVMPSTPISHATLLSPSFFKGFLMRLYRALRGCSCGSRGFLEDRMMDIITGRGATPSFPIFRIPLDHFTSFPSFPADSTRVFRCAAVSFSPLFPPHFPTAFRCAE